ncbi:ribonuclease M5 [Fictibacillus enclensis]|uniref:Ribonuclease M5 n=1 Tax=Fictibacillus enclensis TaxID=1017270 RepID=A0A0V8IP59_9BACL|nr:MULTISPECIES: ribonuclease M5 [Fictibacillus]KSU76551.1 ribonuclease M5 [Fictibacillus enclensis]MDM5335949.1 ribonuclease M5 [Fictibacillus enclensis]RXZ01060.1 ribonuclease M5 [Fictibacillus sp. S7]WHY72447.1 ribonuclease M5 [Fictibacillus enclensis]SCC42432.1 ribonuclease M5 [Fictibacillus enclensis]
MKIKEVIVVEGKSDTTVIQNAVNADTLETNGSEISEETIEQIRLAQEKRGVIIFTDPDYPGERIRKIISNNVPGCKHAFLPKQEAIAKNKRGLGVEHASKESIREALDNVKEEYIEEVERITWNDLVSAGLIGGPKAKARREKLGRRLRIGYMNGKQLHKRLMMFQITEEQFADAILEIQQEERE